MDGLEIHTVEEQSSILICELKCGFGGSTLGDVGDSGGPDAALELWAESIR